MAAPKRHRSHGSQDHHHQTVDIRRLAQAVVGDRNSRDDGREENRPEPLHRSMVQCLVGVNLLHIAVAYVLGTYLMFNAEEVAGEEAEQKESRDGGDESPWAMQALLKPKQEGGPEVE